MKVTILGAGITGLVAAYELSKKGHQVTVLEKQFHIGGSLRCIDVKGTFVEESYHVVFPNQNNTINLIEELGLKDKLKWYLGSTGFYADKLHDATTPIDFLKYKPLKRIDRIKVMSAILKLRRIKDHTPYENTTAKEWITANAGEKAYSDFFKPMLASKFGDRADEISAIWFISRMALRNNRKWNGETIGYLDGSFKLVLDELANRIEKNEGKIIPCADIVKITIDNNKATEVKYLANNIKPPVELSISADSVISTIPTEELNKLANLSLPTPPYEGLICALLSLKKKLSKHFWVNVMRPESSIKYLVELTSLAEVQGKNLVYLGNYQPNSSSMFILEENELFDMFFADLQKLFPEITKEDVDFWHVGKIKNVCIVNTCEANKMVREASLQTPISNLFAAGVFNCWPDTNVDLSVAKVRKLLTEANFLEKTKTFHNFAL